MLCLFRYLFGRWIIFDNLIIINEQCPLSNFQWKVSTLQIWGQSQSVNKVKIKEHSLNNTYCLVFSWIISGNHFAFNAKLAFFLYYQVTCSIQIFYFIKIKIITIKYLYVASRYYSFQIYFVVYKKMLLIKTCSFP